MSIWKTESVRLPAAAMLAAWVLASSAFGASSNASNEPTGEEVIQRFIEVTGGKDAYAKLKSRSAPARFRCRSRT